MQATLLSIAIALILALVAALVGPHFVDWNNYRSQFETQASRLTGLQVRIAGGIDARLLPAPSLSLQRIDVTRPGDVGSVRARQLHIEFSLGALVRGEFKATEVVLDGAEVTAALDRSGRVEWPAPSVGFDPDGISIERLEIRDSRILLADAASGYGMVLDQLEFKGEMRTLSGPVKGQGSFTADGRHYPYRIAAGRVGDDRVRVRINVDPIDQPLNVDAEGFVSIENGMPRFVGAVTMARPLTRAPAGSHAEILEPWRLTGKIDGNSQRAVVEQIEFQYGPDERPIRLRGDARLSFGAAPRLIGVLSSPQLDLDRILALAEAERRPLAAIRNLAGVFSGLQRPPIPIALGLSVESLTFAGMTLQRVNGDIASAANGWNIERLDLRAPGLSQLATSGRIDLADGVSFAGRVRLVSKEPRALIAWLTDRPESEVTAASNLSIDGDVMLGRNAIAVERLRAEFDRMTAEGRVAYAGGDGQKPARLEAALTAPDIDLDRAYGLLRGLFEGAALAWPQEGLLSAKIDRATLAGVEARRADIGVRFDAQGLAIERFSVGDFGGASLAATGTVDARPGASRGTVKVDFDARRLDGIVALLERLAPAAAAELRRHGARLAPAKFSGALEFKPGPASVAQSIGQFSISGAAGILRVGLSGDLAVANQGLTIAGLSHWRSARGSFNGEIDTRDGAALMALLGLERFIAVPSGSARVTASARGALDGDLAIEGRLAGDGLDAIAKGDLRFAGDGGPTAALEMKIARAGLRLPRSANSTIEQVPVAGSARLSLTKQTVTLGNLAGTVAGTDIGGRLAIDLAEPAKLEGELSLGTLHFPAAVAALVGVPKVSGGLWPAEPFEPGVIGSLTGSVGVRIGRMALSPQLAVSNMRGMLQLGTASVSLEGIEGAIAGGRLAGSVGFERGGEGLSLDAQVRVSGADLAQLLPADGVLAGRASIEFGLQGTGRSPVALIGSLKGDGTFTIQDGGIMRLDPSAFALVMRSVDEGLPIDATRIGERMDVALARGALRYAVAQGDVVWNAGLLRITHQPIATPEAHLDTKLEVDLAGGALDARLVLSGPGASETARPQVAMALRGPFGDIRRTLDVASFVNWLAVRAIEQRDKHIDALQAGQGAPPTVPVQPIVAPAATTPVAVPVPQKPVGPSKAAPQRTPAAKVLPPTDIRPPPATRPQPPSKQAQPQRPAVRSWLENLLGP